MSQDRRLERIEKKIDDQNEHLASIDRTLVEQHASLKHHIRRTDLLEKQIEPINKHVARVEGALKLIGLLATITAIVAAVKGLL